MTNERYEMTETTIERLCVDHMRTRCEHCTQHSGANKHTAVLVMASDTFEGRRYRVCWCCWFDYAFTTFLDERARQEYHFSRERARRQSECAGVMVFGTTGLQDGSSSYWRSEQYVRDVYHERLKILERILSHDAG